MSTDAPAKGGEKERVFFEVADMDGPEGDYPFAVIAIYPDRPNASGCLGVVKSLHIDRADAELSAQAHRSGAQ